MTTYDEILGAARTVPGFAEKTTQTDDEWLKELAKLVAVVSDETWNKLSKQAQTWYNMTVKAVNGGNKLPECNGYTYSAVVLVPPKEEPPKLEKTDKPASPITSTRAPRTPGAIDAIRKTVIMHLDWSIEQVYNHVLNNGFPTISRATVEVNVGDIRKCMKVAEELGWKPPHK